MSHITVMKTEFAVQEYLIIALREVGAVLGSASENSVCAQLRIANKDLTLTFRRQEKTFQIEADWWGIPETERDATLGKLKQRYVHQVALATYLPQGYEVVSEIEESGRINLVLRKISA